MKQCYLASPYSYKSQIPFVSTIVRYCRYRKVTEIAAKLTEKYRYAFILPITQSHQISKYMKNKGTSFKDWAAIDYKFIDTSEEVWVVMLDGWKESIGVQAEIEYAINHKKTVRFINENLEIVTSMPAFPTFYSPTGGVAYNLLRQPPAA